MEPDFEQLAAELVRALRGRRSQVALSRRLGFNTNVLHTWERKKRSPSAGQLLELAGRTGCDLPLALAAFFRRPCPWLSAFDPRSTDSLQALLQEIRGALPTVQLVELTGHSRFALTRRFTGAAV